MRDCPYFFASNRHAIGAVAHIKRYISGLIYSSGSMATNADPNYAKAYYFGAECWLKLGDIDAALAEWLLLSKIDEELAENLRNMLMLL